MPHILVTLGIDLADTFQSLVQWQFLGTGDTLRAAFMRTDNAHTECSRPENEVCATANHDAARVYGTQNDSDQCVEIFLVGIGTSGDHGKQMLVPHAFDRFVQLFEQCVVQLTGGHDGVHQLPVEKLDSQPFRQLAGDFLATGAITTRYRDDWRVIRRSSCPAERIRLFY